MPRRATRRRSGARRMLNKVPEVTLVFWIIKILGTTVGETAADYMSETLKLGLTKTTLVTGAVLAGMLVVQFRARRYVPWIYWTVVVLISIAGTLITDLLTDQIGVRLEVTTSVFAVALAATFLVWYRTEHTLSIHSIDTARREAFYWLAILVTFALGTAAGDLLSERVDIGYWEAALLFGALIAVVAVAYYRFGLPEVVAFWTAYILTRPFGASMADFLTQPDRRHGLGLSSNQVSLVCLGLIVVAVGFLTLRQRRADAAIAAP